MQQSSSSPKRFKKGSNASRSGTISGISSKLIWSRPKCPHYLKCKGYSVNRTDKKYRVASALETMVQAPRGCLNELNACRCNGSWHGATTRSLISPLIQRRELWLPYWNPLSCHLADPPASDCRAMSSVARSTALLAAHQQTAPLLLTLVSPSADIQIST